MSAPSQNTVGVPAVRKHFSFSSIPTVDVLVPLGPTLNNAITIVKVTVVSVGAGSSPVCTWKLQSQVPGSAAVDLTAASNPTFAATSAAKDLAVTSAALQNVAAGAHLVANIDYTSGTIPPSSITVEFFDSDGLS